MIGLSKRIAVALSLLFLCAGVSGAGLLTIPITKLTPSPGQYYTDIIGGGIGSPLLMTGGTSGFAVGVAPNDDGFAKIALGFSFDLFGTDYTELWVNNNGIVSFGGEFDTWQPGGVSAANVPTIAPFYADVDTTGVDPITGKPSGVMHLRNDIPNEIIITWDQVGYYRQETDKLNSFQLVIRGTDYASPAGEGEVGFFYKTMTWETGDGLGDGGLPIVDGFGAAIGFGDGIGNSAVLLEGSQLKGLSGIVSDQHIWFDRGVAPGLFAAPVEAPAPQVPEPASLLLVGTGAAFLGRKLLYSRNRQA